jgi:outer membrane lipoprotein-sorting protein
MKLMTFFILILLFFFSACEEYSTTPVSEDVSNNSKGMMKIAMDMATAPSEVVHLEGKLYNRDGDEIYFDFEINDNLATASVEDISSGSWILQVDAFDENDDIIYTGRTEVPVHPGVETPVTLHLNPATGSLQIVVTWV